MNPPMSPHPTRTIALSDGWRFRQRTNRSLEADVQDAANWYPVRVPGTVFQHLLEHGLIPDPFFGRNEHDLQWVGESDWLYRLGFDLDGLEPDEQAILYFDGLDTFAQVWLNGVPILQSDNMFVPHGVVITQKLRAGRNELIISFESPWRRGLEAQAAHGGPKPLWNGDPSRLQVRKAQYHYGWDWGPKLLDLGPWRGVRLKVFTAHIKDVESPITVQDDLSNATITVKLELEGNLEGTQAVVSVRDPDGNTFQTHTMDASDKTCKLEHRIQIASPRLWWPHGYGNQPLYTLEVRLEHDGIVLDRFTRRLGVRRLRLIQEPVQNEPGSSFYFEINNTPVFCGGANWIPDDTMLARITPERYRTRVQQARDANMIMLRVWGGGIYEDDAFYDACDDLGLLVWQDFMFGCGIYPAHDAFLESVRTEASANIRRLRHHPCLSIWTGNNEDYQLAHGLGWYDPSIAPEQDTRFPARRIYERLLPELVRELDPGRFYQPGSPFQGRDPDDGAQGDRHTWDVWGRAALPYRTYRQLGGRFVSEFGMAAAPHLKTLQTVLPADEQTPHSRSFEHHLKAGEGMRRLQAYLSDTQPVPADLPGFVYATQLVQSEALDCAFRIWRRRWGQPGQRAVGGALVWQLNDCWPVTGWAVVDSHGLPKPAYFAIKRALEPITVNLWPCEGGAEVWAVNGNPEPVETHLELMAFSLYGRVLISEQRTVELAPNSATELGSFLPNLTSAVIRARLLDEYNVHARATLFPEPFKHFMPPEPHLEVERLDAEYLRLRVQHPAKCVWLDAPGAIWSDNGLDLLPDEARVIHVSGLKHAVHVRWLDGSRIIELPTHALQSAD